MYAHFKERRDAELGGLSRAWATPSVPKNNTSGAQTEAVFSDGRLKNSEIKVKRSEWLGVPDPTRPMAAKDGDKLRRS
jgi:hypothetical protein